MSKKREKWQAFMERNRKSNGYLLRKTVFNIGYKICRAVLIFGLCFLIVQPLLNKVSLSFMAEQDLYDSTIVNIPRNFTTSSYKLASDLMDYWKALGTTTVISLIVSLFQVAAATLVGYGFARYKFPFKNFWFFMVILVIIVPPQTIMAPLYLNFTYFDPLGLFSLVTGKPINLINTIIPYLLMCFGCMGLKSGLYIYLIRQFFRNVPKDIEEAAYVDGCGKFKTFYRIMLPDAKPIITSCFLFAFVWQWTDKFYAQMFLRKYTLLSTQLSGLSGALDAFIKNAGIAEKATQAYSSAIVATGTLMTIIPLLVIYVFAQKGFVESLSQSGIKM
ncbi:MAG: carbohydrate ABC transporter permease [Lachnospiraceae bacterium]|nr:carbohydrate ABC transporter permease [Lachnospiraceae bacterium]